MRNMPVIHLHGRLGFLPWQSGESRLYDSEITAESLRTGANNINIIHEDITDGRDKDFSEAKRLLADAEQVLLMGFGYNSTNVERLGIADLAAGKSKGTCQGLGGSGEKAA